MGACRKLAADDLWWKVAMSANQLLAVKIAEKLLDALPFRGGATTERIFVARSAVIVLEVLNSARYREAGSNEASQDEAITDSVSNKP